MERLLDLSNVRVYTKEDAAEAFGLIDQDVYMSDDKDFEVYYELKLVGVQVMSYSIPPFLGDDGKEIEAYKYFILAKDAKFKEGKEIKMDKEIDKAVASTEGEIRDNSTERKQLWKEIINVGNSFWVRSKDNTKFVHLVTVTELSVNSEGSIVSIGLGTSVFPPKELLKNYEWSNKSPKDNDWRPFSILLTY